MGSRLKAATLILVAGSLGTAILRRRRSQPAQTLEDQVVLITGGSRGLGFLLAEAFAEEGCRLVICARDASELQHAQAVLERQGADVLAHPCDVGNRTQVEHLVQTALQHFGRIDVLVNNAGIIQVGPIETMTHDDFSQAMDVMFWGVVNPTLAVLPSMRQRGRGRIVNITSIGGKVSVPHLLPYNSAKFAAVGFSEGIRAELAGSGISVTTIVPGLMRTGSYLHALFKGDEAREFTWFSLSSSLPFITMNAEQAAREIVEAARRGETERVLTLPARVLALFHGLFPGLTADIAGLVARYLLPDADWRDTETTRGMEVQEQMDGLQSQVMETLTLLGRRGAYRSLQFPGPNWTTVDRTRVRAGE